MLHTPQAPRVAVPWLLTAALIGLIPEAPEIPEIPEAPGDSASGLTPTDALQVNGVTISCRGWGQAWGTPGFDAELDDLASLGVNWVAIHPYARIHEDGSLSWRSLEPTPEHLARPLRAARSRGVSLLIKPHLSYWGSSFDWRGAIDFEEPAARARFWRDYTAWIVELASSVSETDAFVVGTELDRFLGTRDEGHWRALIAKVRDRTGAHLTYAANWSDYADVPFWDALDAIGVQAYFPLSEQEALDTLVTEDRARVALELEQGWNQHLVGLRALSLQTGKPVVFTELGYPASSTAAREPWSYHEERGEGAETAQALQAELLRVALSVLERERAWLRGAFLWKWFVGGAPRANFRLDTPRLRAVLTEAWLTEARRGAPSGG